jgi:hypothetical protein
MPADARLTGLQRLGIGVLRLAIEDAAGRDGHQAGQARAWLGSDGDGLELWATLAGVSVRQIRRRLAGGPPAPSTPTQVAQDDEAA